VRRFFGCLVCLLVVLSVLSVGVSAAQTAQPSHPQDAGLPTTVEDVDELSKVDWGTTTPTTATETVVIELRDTATEERLNVLRSRGASVELTHDTLVEAKISGDVSKYTELPWVERARKPIRPVTGFREGARSIGADEAHAAGVTGEDASVAVIDAGFRPDNERISDNIAEQKAFGVTGISGIQPRHGTASAEMVVDVAPDADLYIATVSTDVGYMNAIDWATENDVDVITTSLGFPGLPNDGTSDISQKSAEAVEDDDVVFTASAGNSARLHWQGEFSDTRSNDLLEFPEKADEKAEVNFFTDRNGNPTELTSGSVVRTDLTWDDWETVSTNYNLHLVRVGSPGEEPETVRSADTDARGFEPVKRIQTQVLEDGFYGVMVEQTEGTEETVELFADSSLPRSGLRYKTPESSVIAPSAAEGVLGIAAFRYNTGEIEPYSSRGPTNDGRRGISVAAPTCSTSSAYDSAYCGTSGAAPHAGGVAALASSAADLSASELRSVIQDASDDTSATVREGGDGNINATEAVEKADGDEDTGPKEPVLLDGSNVAISDGGFEVTVEKGEYATAAVEGNSENFGVNLSVVDDGGDSPTVISENRIEFIDIDKESSTYVLKVNVTGGAEGDTGEITAYVGGNADSDDNESSVLSTFSVVGVVSSSVEGVSDDLWTVVTMDDGETGLSLADLGNAIQEYRENPSDAGVGGVSIGLSELGSLIQHYRTEVA